MTVKTKEALAKELNTIYLCELMRRVQDYLSRSGEKIEVTKDNLAHSCARLSQTTYYCLFDIKNISEVYALSELRKKYLLTKEEESEIYDLFLKYRYQYY